MYLYQIIIVNGDEQRHGLIRADNWYNADRIGRDLFLKDGHSRYGWTYYATIYVEQEKISNDKIVWL